MITLIAAFGCSHSDEQRIANPTPGAISPTAVKPPVPLLSSQGAGLGPTSARTTLPDRANFIAAEPPATSPRHERDYDY